MVKAETYNFCAYDSCDENEPFWLDTVISKSDDVHNTELPAVYATGSGQIASEPVIKTHTISSSKWHEKAMVNGAG